MQHSSAAARLGARAAAARRRLLAPQRSPSSCPPCSGRRHRGGGAPPAAAAALSPPAEAPPPPTSPPPSAREPHLRAQVEALFAAALRAAFPDESASWSLAPAVAPCANPAHGDYQCNTPLPLFARLKAERPGAAASPRDIAARLLAALPPSPLVEAASVAGAGFVNVRLSRPALAARLAGLLTRGPAHWAPPVPHGARRVVVDFSSPNIAKEMHVGHLRSTILGDTLARCLEYCGASVLRLNHVGDWGTQFGMLIEHLSDASSDGDASMSLGDLQTLYRAAKARFDAEPAFKARAQAAVVRLQAGAPAETALWKSICAASRSEFEALYVRLGVVLEERGESFYNPFIPAVLDELAAKGVSVMSDGAQCIFPPGSSPSLSPAASPSSLSSSSASSPASAPPPPQQQPTGAPPLIVRKSDGGFSYASTDLAALWQRSSVERADWVIYVTDVGQAGHFSAVFTAARAAGWVGPTMRLDHVGFGLVQGEDGKRFRTRSTETVRLADLLDEASDRCAASLRSRPPPPGEAALDEQALRDAGEAIGVAAVKYADLCQNKASNYVFSFDKMLDMRGNTAVYLLYAYARICSILRKAGAAPGDGGRLCAAAGGAAGLCDAWEAPSERALALSIARLPEAVEAALLELSPNRLTEYLYGLSGAFTDFYGACPVLGDAAGGKTAARLALCEAAAAAMRQVFFLLGIVPLNRL